MEKNNLSSWENCLFVRCNSSRGKMDLEAREEKKRTWGDFWTKISKVSITPHIVFVFIQLLLLQVIITLSANEPPVLKCIRENPNTLKRRSRVGLRTTLFSFFSPFFKIWVNLQTDVFSSPLSLCLLGEKISAHFQWAGAKFSSLITTLGWWY